MSHIGYMIFDTQLDRQMNLRDVRREGRIDSETEFERHWCKHRTGAEKEINPETESAVRKCQKIANWHVPFFNRDRYEHGNINSI